MSCHQSNYSIQVGDPVADQSISFETHGSITITFTPPTTADRVTGVSFSPNPPPTGQPTPSTTGNTITFSDPSGGTTDYDVTVTHTDSRMEFETPTTTLKFKPRTTCPTG